MLEMKRSVRPKKKKKKNQKTQWKVFPTEMTKDKREF
jgi:hypothetical protein